MKYAIFLNGEYPEFIEEYKELLKDRLIYCADGGANFVYRERILPNVILGDLDSITSEALEYFKLLENNRNMISITSSNEYVVFVDKKYEIKDKQGYIASPVPLTDIKSLTLKGFVYNLENKDIPSTTGLVSNVVADNLAIIECIEGKILLFLRKEN